MRVPPLPPSGNIPGSMPNSLVQQLYMLWQNWYADDNPKDQVRNGTALLQFLEKNHAYFEMLSKNNPNPQAVSFDESYSSAINSLQNWLQYGASANDKTAPSEFVNDVYDWVAYVNQ